MNDQYSAPVSEAAFEKLLKSISDVKDLVHDLTTPSCDSIALHQLGDEFEGLGRQFHDAAQAAVDAHIEANPTRYEVQTHTVVDGWVNVWAEDENPVTFPSRHSAQAELNGFFKDLPDYMADGYDRADYRVAEVQS